MYTLVAVIVTLSFGMFVFSPLGTDKVPKQNTTVATSEGGESTSIVAEMATSSDTTLPEPVVPDETKALAVSKPTPKLTVESKDLPSVEVYNNSAEIFDCRIGRVDWGDGASAVIFDGQPVDDTCPTSGMRSGYHTYTKQGTYIITYTDAKGSTEYHTVIVPDIYHVDEGIFSFTLNAETVEHFVGIDSWTEEKVDYWYVPYQVPARAPWEKRLILDNVVGFEYNPKYEYVIRVERLRGEYYHAEDATWYKYNLVSIDEKELAT